MKKTIAETMREVLLEYDETIVGWGWLVLLDECASRCKHTSLSKAHPLDRHKRILDALGRSTLFEQFLFRVWVGNREALVRAFRLVER